MAKGCSPFAGALLAALVGFILLVVVSPAKAGFEVDPPEPIPKEKVYTCEKRSGGQATGTNITSVAMECWASDAEEFSYAVISYGVRNCNPAPNPATCERIQNYVECNGLWGSARRCSVNVQVTVTGIGQLSWIERDGCGAVGDSAKSGYFDTGPTAGATPLLIACAGRCGVSYDGESPQYSALVNGEKHWFARGTYRYNGRTCTEAESTAKGVGTPSTSKPADTCGPNQDQGTVNGKSVCVDKTTGTPSEDSKAKENEKTETTTRTNPDGSTTTTETTTRTNADGTTERTVTTTTTRPDGSSTKDSETTKDEPPEKGKCEKNPSEAGCGGEGAAIGELYTGKDKTLQSVLGAHRDAFMSSAFGSAVGGFFVVSAGGACPTFSGHIPFIDAEFVIDQFCSSWATMALAMFRAALLVACSFFAFRVAVE